MGAVFDRGPDGSLRMGLEAAHTRPRIIHAGGDRTGAALMAWLTEIVRADPLIEILEHTEVAALRHDGLSVTGVIALGESGAREIPAPDVVLATGGVGQLYAVTTNPLVATGDGWALAWQVGAELRDLEFLQFHPTALKLPGVNPAPLITEAVRGAGGLLWTAMAIASPSMQIRAVNWRPGMLWPAQSRRPMLRAVPGSTRGRFRISVNGSPGSPASWPLTESIRRRS